MGNDKTQAKVSWVRICLAIAYAVIGVLIVVIRAEQIFYLQAEAESYNFDRFLWCIACSSVGFAVIAFIARKHWVSPFPSYVFYYPFVLLVIAASVFSICHLFAATSGFVFYYLSGAGCASLGYLVDHYWDLLLRFLLKKR